METFGLSRNATLATLAVFGVAILGAVFWFFYSAPPKTLTITTGTEGSTFQMDAEKYVKILASNHVTLRILPSDGSLENLRRLNNHSMRVDIGFVQGGVTNDLARSKLVSLGSVAYEPLFIFYRNPGTVALLSDFRGKRLAIGPPGSGTRSLAMSLLELNEITNAAQATFLDLDSQDAAKALLAGTADAIFLMGDSASPQILRQLLRNPEIQLFDFTQADGYTRKISYLNKLVLPQGSIDFGRNIPAHDVALIGPTVEILARPNLHPALSDLLLGAAQQVHGGASLLKRKGEFPAALEHDFPVSPDASRFYKSGKGFFYRYLPFWLASLLGRTLGALVPLLVVLIPGLKVLPGLYRLRIRLRTYRWYRALLVLERDRSPMTPARRTEVTAKLNHIESEVNRMKVPASFADQFYGLREHIAFVRSRLLDGNGKPVSNGETPPAE